MPLAIAIRSRQVFVVTLSANEDVTRHLCLTSQRALELVSANVHDLDHGIPKDLIEFSASISLGCLSFQPKDDFRYTIYLDDAEIGSAYYCGTPENHGWQNQNGPLSYATPLNAALALVLME